MSKQTILIVDDDVLVGEFLADVINKGGYHAVYVDCGETAISSTEEHQPALILMDVGLPGLDGFETARRILTTNDIPVIFITAFSDEAMIERAAKISLWGFLMKPVNESQLIASIGVTLRLYALIGQRRIEKPVEQIKWLLNNASITEHEEEKLLTVFSARFGTSSEKMNDEILSFQRQDKMRDVVERLPVLIDAHDESGTIVFWNKECERVTGYDAEDIVNNPRAFEMLYPEKSYRDDVTRLLRMEGDGFKGLEVTMTCHDGSRKTISWTNISKQYPISGWASWAVGIDVTGRLEAEEQKKRSEERLRTLLQIHQMEDQTLFMNFIVEECARQSGSEMAFFGLVSDDQRFMHAHLWSSVAMDKCFVEKKPTLFSIEDAGLWAESIRQRKPVIVNDFILGDPLLKGLPCGHVPLTRFMSIPVMVNDKVVAIVGVANKAEHYDDKDGTHLNLLVHSMWDAISRKRSEEELRESERKYRNLFDTMFHGFAWCQVLVDQSGIVYDWLILEINASCERITGFTQGQVIGRPMTEIIPRLKDSNPELFDVLGNVALTGECTRFETWLDPLQKWLSITAYCPRHGHFVALFDDITERKLAEERLRFSDSRHRTILKIALDGFWLLDQQGRFLEVNDAYCAMSGYTREELLTMSIEDVEARETPIDTRNRIDKIVTCGYDRFETWHRHKDGSLFQLEINTQYLKDDGGRFFAFLRDITRERQMEQNYKTLFYEMLDGFALHEIILDDRGEPVDYRFIVVNPAFERITGLKAENIIGKTVLQVLPDTEPYWIEKYGRVALTGEPVFFEDFSGAIGKYFLVTAFSTTKNQFACIFTDITERKLAEGHLQSSLEEKELLLKEIHHRVKNNLQVVLSLLRLQSQKITDREAAENYRDLQNRIQAMALIHEILYKSTEIGKIFLRRYVETMVANIVQSYRQRAIHSSLDIIDTELTITKAIPLGFILNELITNVMKHAFGGDREGTLTMRCHVTENDMLCLEIQDNGPGFPDGFLDKNSTGLTLVRMMTRQLKGTIEFTNDGGGRVTLVLPLT